MDLAVERVGTVAACGNSSAPPTPDTATTSSAVVDDDAVRAACKGAYENEGQCVSCVAEAGGGGALVSEFARGECRDGCIHTTCAIEGATCGTISDLSGGSLVCGLPAPVPFAPLAGTASASGTLGLGPDVSCNGAACCAPITAAGTDGVVTFDIQSSTCSFSFDPTGTGRVYSSVINRTPTFDGDTYTCSFSRNEPVFDNAATYAACPELSQNSTGLGANVRLTVTRSTGAVTVHRFCERRPNGCFAPNWVPGTSHLDVAGSRDCGSGG